MIDLGDRVERGGTGVRANLYSGAAFGYFAIVHSLVVVVLEPSQSHSRPSVQLE